MKESVILKSIRETKKNKLLFNLTLLNNRLMIAIKAKGVDEIISIPIDKLVEPYVSDKTLLRNLKNVHMKV